MISAQTIAAITQRIDILDVVGEFVKLKKRGSNYLGLCPFHGEKTPSFTVSPAKEIYKCFGCGKSGNSISFLMEHEKYSYVEALKWLAARYNIEVEESFRSPEQALEQQVADSLYALNHFARGFFQQQLWETEEGKTIALSYLQQRGFRQEILEKFQVGYSPAFKKSLSTALLENQYNTDLFPKTGLVVDRQGEWTDNYRERIVFPIHNISGKVIGFGARVIGQSDRGPKYINTPENEIYSKSRVLYGLYQARVAIDKADECLLVEGYTDVVSLHQAGIENVVASGGTSLTLDQLRLIKKYTQQLTIVYDGDKAGIKAALRGLDLAVEEGLNVKLVLIPDGEDPDSYVYKVGTQAFRDFVAKAKKDFILFQLEILLQDAGQDLNRKSQVVNQMAETLSKISRAEDFTRQQEYIRQCAALMRIDESGFTNLVNQFKRNKIAKEEKKIPFAEAKAIAEGQEAPVWENDVQSLLQQDDGIEKNLLRVLLEHGLKPFDAEKTIAQYVFEGLEMFHLENPVYLRFLTLYQTAYNQGEQPDEKYFMYHPEDDIRQLVVGLTLSPHELSLRWDEIMENMQILNKDVSQTDALVSLNYFKLRKLKKMFAQNQADMADAPYEEQLALIKVHNQLKEIERQITQSFGTVILP